MLRKETWFFMNGNIDVFIDVLLANDLRNLLINMPCVAFYGFFGCCFFGCCIHFCECFFGCENKTDTFSKKLIENIQCIWRFSQSLSQSSISSISQVTVSLFSKTFKRTPCRGVFRTQPNICDRAFLRKYLQLLAANYFRNEAPL